MPCIYLFKIKKHHIFLRNVGPSILQKKLHFFAIFLQVFVCAKKLANYFSNFCPTIISENSMILFNFKLIYAWHFYGTRDVKNWPSILPAFFC